MLKRHLSVCFFLPANQLCGTTKPPTEHFPLACQNRAMEITQPRTKESPRLSVKAPVALLGPPHKTAKPVDAHDTAAAAAFQTLQL